ncbi:hypothetical protein FF1_036118 [Malus domestica]
MFQRLMADLNCFFTMIAKQGSERERADQDEDASGKPDNEGGSFWDFVNRLSQLKAVDIFCIALPDHPLTPQRPGFHKKDEAPNRNRVGVMGIAPVRLFPKTLNV